MELTVNIKNKKVYSSLIQFLKSLNISVISADKKKKVKMDGVTLLSEKSLAEEWNSKEDDAWDKVL